MQVLHPTFCLHSDVFRITTVVLKLMSTTDQSTADDTMVTNDPVVLPGGTAYLTDCGMTGPHDSVIGVRTEIALRRFLTQLPARSEPALTRHVVYPVPRCPVCSSTANASPVSPWHG